MGEFFKIWEEIWEIWELWEIWEIWGEWAPWTEYAKIKNGTFQTNSSK